MFPLSCIMCAWILDYCNTVRWAWLDWGLSGWLTILLQCFDTAGWVIRLVKTSSLKWPAMCRLSSGTQLVSFSMDKMKQKSAGRVPLCSDLGQVWAMCKHLVQLSVTVRFSFSCDASIFIFLFRVVFCVYYDCSHQWFGSRKKISKNWQTTAFQSPMWPVDDIFVLPGVITSLCLDTVSARMGVGHLLLSAQLPGTHWVMICVIQHLALTVSDVCLKLSCFHSTSTYSSTLEVSHFMWHINSRRTHLLQ